MKISKQRNYLVVMMGAFVLAGCQQTIDFGFADEKTRCVRAELNKVEKMKAPNYKKLTKLMAATCNADLEGMVDGYQRICIDMKIVDKEQERKKLVCSDD
ncbi:MAG: hypothetical protein DSY80_08800 [Desulfocapsa sp.]|nr:MAG: hypothetical protein DSY80_08800 [Desulfocapsa sp.]